MLRSVNSAEPTPVPFPRVRLDDREEMIECHQTFPRREDDTRDTRDQQSSRPSRQNAFNDTENARCHEMPAQVDPHGMRKCRCRARVERFDSEASRPSARSNHVLAGGRRRAFHVRRACLSLGPSMACHLSCQPLLPLPGVGLGTGTSCPASCPPWHLEGGISSMYLQCAMV